MQALRNNRSEIGGANALVVDKFWAMLDAATADGEKHELVQFCRLDRTYAADKRRLTLAVRISELREALAGALTQLGAERRFGRAPPSFMERELQQWLEAMGIAQKQ